MLRPRSRGSQSRSSGKNLNKDDRREKVEAAQRAIAGSDVNRHFGSTLAGTTWLPATVRWTKYTTGGDRPIAGHCFFGRARSWSDTGLRVRVGTAAIPLNLLDDGLGQGFMGDMIVQGVQLAIEPNVERPLLAGRTPNRTLRPLVGWRAAALIIGDGRPP